MPPIKIYTWNYCPYCVRAKRFFEEKGWTYGEINLEGKDDEMQKLIEKTHHRTVPQIFIGDTFIGGYTDLMEKERSGELAKIIET